MNRSDILQALDSEISRLQQARTLLADAPDEITEVKAARRNPGSPKKLVKKAAKQTKAPAAKKRTMSPEGRASIAAAQKARWAKLKKSGRQAPTSKAAKENFAMLHKAERKGPAKKVQ